MTWRSSGALRCAVGMAACSTAGAVLVMGAAAVLGGPAEGLSAQPAPGVVAEAAATSSPSAQSSAGASRDPTAVLAAAADPTAGPGEAAPGDDADAGLPVLAADAGEGEDHPGAGWVPPPLEWPAPFTQQEVDGAIDAGHPLRLVVDGEGTGSVVLTYLAPADGGVVVTAGEGVQLHLEGSEPHPWAPDILVTVYSLTGVPEGGSTVELSSDHRTAAVVLTTVVCPTECTHLDEPLTEQLSSTAAALSVRVLGPVAPGAEVVATVDGSDVPVVLRATDDRTYRAVVPVVPGDAVGYTVQMRSPVRRSVMGTHLSEAWSPG